ncbi:MAG TPA: hypothetical protein PKN47_22600 [Nitrospira sp.]|nr:hypothetical protein [Nitrospira sp.]
MESKECGLDSVRQVLNQHFPDLWPAVEAGLSTSATLLLGDNSNPVTLILCGASGCGKSTATNMFDGVKIQGNPFTYRSDKFTTASFVSHSAQATREQLQEVDLLPKIKNKVLLTPELSPIFRGKADELTLRFSMLTRVLDGQGLMTDSGTHGQRGYEGPHVFAWIGATTPLDASVWEIMATLGSRLFFLMLDTEESTSIDDLVASLCKEVSHADGVEECKTVIEQFLNDLFTRHQGVAGVQWDSSRNKRPVLEGIARFADLMALLRTPFKKDSRPMPESPRRANAVLYNMARGHALIHGRTELTPDDLPLIAQVASSSIPHERRAILLAMANNVGKPLTVQLVADALGVSRHTAETAMEEMDWLGFALLSKPGNGLTTTLSHKSKWDWFMSGEGLAYLQAATWQNLGGERTPRTSQPLSSLDREREGKEDVGSTRIPRNLPGSATP